MPTDSKKADKERPSLGSGLAEKAAKASEQRRERQKGRLDSITGQIERQRKAQTSDSDN